ncbi:MAG TPA: PilN domain-containing protein [Polyangiales bacterium]
MIRINLLPHKRSAAASPAAGARVWGYAYLGAAAVWCLALAFVYFGLMSDLEQAKAQNAEIERQVKLVKDQSGNLEELQKQLEQSKKLEEVVRGLRDARQGPHRMLLELSAILSPGRGPTIDPVKLDELRRSNPEAGITSGWDTRRLWVSGFEEYEPRKCRIVGEARNNEDIAEFLRRLALSTVFDDVVLVRTGVPRSGANALVAFELTCKMRY